MIPNDAKFKLWFMSGGCGRFLRCVDDVLDKIRANSTPGPSVDLMNHIQSDSFMSEFAYYDPNDPSTIFVS